MFVRSVIGTSRNISDSNRIKLSSYKLRKTADTCAAVLVRMPVESCMTMLATGNVLSKL